MTLSTWTIILGFLAVVATAIAIWKFREAEKARDELGKVDERIRNLQAELEDAEIKLLGAQNDFAELRDGIRAYYTAITAPYGVKLSALRRILFSLVGIDYDGGGLGE
jgi:hypothetical protein